MHILLTNDDGVTHPGLAALAQVFQQEHQVTILAPDHNWSASGHVKTLHRPLRIWDTRLADGTPALTTDGAPSDCVSLAVLGIVKDPIDLVVSGINPLANLGHDVTYSGTVTAAMEATISGIPAIAISLDVPEGMSGEADYSPTVEVALRLLNILPLNDIPKGVFLNINVPYMKVEEMKGIRITGQGQSIYREELIRRRDPRGQEYCWIGGDSPTGHLDPGTDFHALAKGYVSITPLQLDLTAHSHIQTLEEWSLEI